jgi:hypothetical protein
MTGFHDDLEFDVEIYATDTTTGLTSWHDVTSHVRYADRVTITGGYKRTGVAVADPATSRLTLNNTTGDFDPENPVGRYFGSLHENTPLRIARVLDRAEFTTNQAEGWPATVRGETWTTFGSGGVLSATDYSSSSGKGRHSIPATNAARMTYLAVPAFKRVQVRADVQMPVADITGDGVAAVVAVRGVDTADFMMVRVTITLLDTVQIEIRRADETLIGSVVTTGILHTGQVLRILADFEGETFRGKVWDPAVGEPLAWQVEQETTLNSAAGWVGFRSIVGAANTNPLPFVVSWDNIRIRSARHSGRIPKFEPEWDTSGEFSTVQLDSGDALRAMASGAAPLQSALRRGIPSIDGLVAYWPAEEKDGATSISSPIAGVQPMTIFEGTPDYAAFSGFVGSDPVPNVALSRWHGFVPPAEDTGTLYMQFHLNIPSGGAPDGALLNQLTCTGTCYRWELYYTEAGTGGISIRAFDSAYNVILDSGPHFNPTPSGPVEGSALVIGMLLEQDGADVDWAIRKILPVDGDDFSPLHLANGTLAGYTLGIAIDARIAVGAVLDSVAFGHVLVANEDPFNDLEPLIAAYFGEASGRRMERLCREADVPFTYIGDLDDTTPMGVQGDGTLLDQIKECVEVDQGALYASRSTFGLLYKTGKSLYRQDAMLELDLSAGELADPFHPVTDDDRLVNDMEMKRQGGGSRRFQQLTGRRSVADPPEGAGRYPAQEMVNPKNDSYLYDLAAWAVTQSVDSTRRFKRLGVNLANLTGDAVKSRQVLDLDVVDKIVITGAANRWIYDDLAQLAHGYTEIIDGHTHRFEFSTISAAPFQIGVLDNSQPRLDSDTSQLTAALSSSATSFLVSVGDEALWTEDAAWFPLPIDIAGEEITLSGIATVTPGFVGAGTAAHADNASVSPSLHASTATGNTVLVWAAARTTSATVACAGYTTLVDFGHAKLFGKVAGAAEPAPTVTVSGGAAGCTVSAQTATFTNLPLAYIARATQTNGIAQNIATPKLSAMVADGILLHLGWKQDDWTSVAVIPDSTEIGEPDSTLGNDQGIVWNYRATRGAVSEAAQSFVVTGGVTGVSKAAVILLGNWQTFTASQRAANGVTKTHAAGTSVRVKYPFRLGL